MKYFGPGIFVDCDPPEKYNHVLSLFVYLQTKQTKKRILHVGNFLVALKNTASCILASVLHSVRTSLSVLFLQPYRSLLEKPERTLYNCNLCLVT